MNFSERDLAMAMKQIGRLTAKSDMPSDVKTMMDIVLNPKADEQEKELAINTVIEILFPKASIQLWPPSKECMEKARKKKDRDVHTEHCCALHGCKYGDGDNCPVESGKKIQSHLCEDCGRDGLNG